MEDPKTYAFVTVADRRFGRFDDFQMFPKDIIPHFFKISSVFLRF